MPHTSSTGVFLPISLQYDLQYSILVFLTVLLTSACAFLYSIKSKKVCVFLTLLNAFLIFLIAFLHSSFHHGTILFCLPLLPFGIHLFAASLLHFVRQVLFK